MKVGRKRIKKGKERCVLALHQACTYRQKAPCMYIERKKTSNMRPCIKKKECCKYRCYQNMWREKNEKSVLVHACLQIYQKENYKKMNKYKKERKIKEKRRKKGTQSTKAKK